MKRTIRVIRTTTVVIEIPDNAADQALKDFNESIYQTDMNGLFAHMADHVDRNGSHGWIEGVGPVFTVWADEIPPPGGATNVRASSVDEDVEFEHIGGP